MFKREKFNEMKVPREYTIVRLLSPFTSGLVVEYIDTRKKARDEDDNETDEPYKVAIKKLEEMPFEAKLDEVNIIIILKNFLEI